MEKIQFRGYEIYLQTFRTNKDSFRVSAEVGKDQLNNIKNIMELESGQEYLITIEPITIEPV